MVRFGMFKEHLKSKVCNTIPYHIVVNTIDFVVNTIDFVVKGRNMLVRSILTKVVLQNKRSGHK